MIPEKTPVMNPETGVALRVLRSRLAADQRMRIS
jgi:hypothetical protein